LPGTGYLFSISIPGLVANNIFDGTGSNPSLKNILPKPYQHQDVPHLAQQVITNLEGDSRVKGSSLIVTCYTDDENLGFANISKTFH